MMVSSGAFRAAMAKNSTGLVSVSGPAVPSAMACAAFWPSSMGWPGILVPRRPDTRSHSHKGIDAPLPFKLLMQLRIVAAGSALSTVISGTPAFQQALKLAMGLVLRDIV